MNPFSSVSCVSGRVMRGAELFPGCRVLARKEIDGFYYLGTIIHQVLRKLISYEHSLPVNSFGVCTIFYVSEMSLLCLTRLHLKNKNI